MSMQLSEALKRPSMVLRAGPDEGVRNSTKKASGLMKFGASVMLGAALLSPFNALATQQVQAQAQEQTTEVVQSEMGSSNNPWSTYKQVRAQQEAEKLQARRDAPKFELGRNEYNSVKRVYLDGQKFDQASKEQQQEFVSRLAADAYLEMQAGHTVQSPSQRLVDICRHIGDISENQAQAGQVEHGSEVFEACQSEQMQSSMFSNRVKMVAAYTGAGIGMLAIKTISVAAFLAGGSLMMGGGTPAEAKTGPRAKSRLNPEWEAGPNPTGPQLEPDETRAAPKLG